MISRPKGLLQTFPYKALQDGKIIYTHDGTETLTDTFSVIAQTIGIEIESGGGLKGKSPNVRVSSPFSVNVQILPSNDQVPRIVNNTGTWVWAGSTVLLTNSELGESAPHRTLHFITCVILTCLQERGCKERSKLCIKLFINSPAHYPLHECPCLLFD
jgi:hypothetical protein